MPIATVILDGGNAVTVAWGRNPTQLIVCGTKNMMLYDMTSKKSVEMLPLRGVFATWNAEESLAIGEGGTVQIWSGTPLALTSTTTKAERAASWTCDGKALFFLYDHQLTR